MEPPRERVFREGQSAILYAGINKTKVVVLAKGQTQNYEFGSFRHDHIIGHEFGSRIESVGKNRSFIFVLNPVSSLLTDSLARRTQILFQADISAILSRLNVRPGSTVVESGTGSGSLSIGILQSLMGQGHLYTFQFNRERAEAVSKLFAQLDAPNVTVTCRDVLAEGFSIQGVQYKADAVFLDLPSPYIAIEHAAKIIKQGGRICSFSPCLQQVQKAVQAFGKNGFYDSVTIECLTRLLERRERDVHSLEPQPKPAQKRVFFSSGAKEGRGHTGYLTFAIKVS